MEWNYGLVMALLLFGVLPAGICMICSDRWITIIIGKIIATLATALLAVSGMFFISLKALDAVYEYWDITIYLWWLAAVPEVWFLITALIWGILRKKIVYIPFLFIVFCTIAILGVYQYCFT